MDRVKIWHPDQVNTLEFITMSTLCVGACKPTVGCRNGSRSYQIFTWCESIFHTVASWPNSNQWKQSNLIMNSLMLFLC